MVSNTVIYAEKEIRSVDSSNSIEERLSERAIDIRYRGFLSVLKDKNGNLFLMLNSSASPVGNSNNVIIPCENCDALRNAIEKIQLNLEKARIDGQEPSIGALSDERVTIEKGNSGVFAGKDILLNDEIKKKYNEFFELSVSQDVEEQKKAEALDAEISELRGNENTYILASIDDVTFSGKKLESTRKVAEYLIRRANVIKSQDEEIIDLNSQQYGDAIQDYLLKNMYSKQISLSEEQKRVLEFYKGAGFKSINAFLRGNFEDESIAEADIKKITTTILRMEAIAKILPKRNTNIVLGRSEKGINKSREIGSENVYDSFVSFGTNDGTKLDEGGFIYKRVLGKDEPAIPIELLLSHEMVLDSTECEVVTLPFSYSMEDFETSDMTSRISMGNIRNISVTDLLEKRLEQFREIQKKKLEEMGTDGQSISVAYERKKVEKFIEDSTSSLQELRATKQYGLEENIEITELRYFDDEEERKNPESSELLRRTVEESKGNFRFSKIKEAFSRIKSRVQNVMGKKIGLEDKAENDREK